MVRFYSGDQDMSGKWIFHLVDVFIYQQIVPDLKCRQHGAGGNFEDLNDKCTYKKS